MVQEIISEIRKRGKPLNIVIKQDMMKAYNRVDRLFLTKILRKVGFNETIIDMKYRLVGINRHSILLNSQLKGFFRSFRGLK